MEGDYRQYGGHVSKTPQDTTERLLNHISRLVFCIVLLCSFPLHYVTHTTFPTCPFESVRNITVVRLDNDLCPLLYVVLSLSFSSLARSTSNLNVGQVRPIGRVYVCVCDTTRRHWKRREQTYDMTMNLLVYVFGCRHEDCGHELGLFPSVSKFNAKSERPNRQMLRAGCCTLCQQLD